MTIQELEKEIQALEAEAEKYADSLLSMKAQLTKYITSGKKDNEEWYGRASIAYQVMKGKVHKLNVKISKLKSERKAAIRASHENRDRIQNELFFKKLKSLMPEEQLMNFLKECEDIINTRMEYEG